ncbi:hypothetical protein B0H14DRAFT_2571174 [Mycena olivaceomarginata]|nr:hypothetical protein B0H14DRAFT_2571174 [Mycena olivaceomarginata]
MTPRTSNAQRLWVHITPLSLMSLRGADLPLDTLLVNFNKIWPVRVVNHLGGRLTTVFFELPRFRTDIVDVNPNDASSCELQAAGQTDPSERLAASTLPMPGSWYGCAAAAVTEASTEKSALVVTMCEVGDGVAARTAFAAGR